METYNFDNIRSYNDREINSVLTRLLNDEEFIRILNKIFTPERIEEIKANVLKVNTIEQFQSGYISQYANKIIHDTVESLTSSGLENINKNKSYLYISNHRDILLDSIILNELLNRNGIPKTENAIGSNLLIYPWINDLVRLNRSFIVRRDLTGKDMLEGSRKLSSYIRTKITKENSSVWIAQREGRTKDGNDLTQIGLLKMFNFSGEKTLAENFKELNLVPVSVSYEYEPCDAAKTQEIYLKSINETFVKTPGQDLRSMGQGLADKKGNIHFNFGKISEEDLMEICKIPKVNDRYTRLSEIINKEIHKGFFLHKFNYIAYDLIYPEQQRFYSKYNILEKEQFIIYANSKLEKLEGDENALREIFYKIYSNPVKNSFQFE